MDELEIRKQLAVKAMNLEYLPDIPEEKLNMITCQKYSLANISALGVGFQSLVSAVQSFSKGNSAGMSGIYHVNTKGMQMMKFKNGSGFLGTLATEGGTVGGGQAEITPLKCDPTMLCMAMALMNIEKKLDGIQKLQQEMMDFLRTKEKVKLRGDINTLVDVLNNYKFNWDNEKYKTNKHILVQDIRKDSEQSILLYRDQINKRMVKKVFVHSDQEVKAKLKKIQGEFEDYQLALYLYAFSAFLEVMLLENFNGKYLESVTRQMEMYALQYREMYTDCYNRMEDLIGMASNCITPFIENIKIINRIYNEPMEVLFNGSNLYLLKNERME